MNTTNNNFEPRGPVSDNFHKSPNSQTGRRLSQRLYPVSRAEAKISFTTILFPINTHDTSIFFPKVVAHKPLSVSTFSISIFPSRTNADGFSLFMIKATHDNIHFHCFASHRAIQLLTSI